MLFLNDFDAQEKIKRNAEIKSDHSSARPPVREAESIADIFAREREKHAVVDGQGQEEDYLDGIRLKEAIGELAQYAYQYRIYLVILLKETWYRELDDALKTSGNVIVFNETKYQSVADNYLIRDLLKDIRQRRPARPIGYAQEEDDTETDNESFAILRRKEDFQKFRPIIYHADDEEERNRIIKQLEDKAL